jgi:hypothetical protein
MPYSRNPQARNLSVEQGESAGGAMDPDGLGESLSRRDGGLPRTSRVHNAGHNETTLYRLYNPDSGAGKEREMVP